MGLEWNNVLTWLTDMLELMCSNKFPFLTYGMCFAGFNCSGRSRAMSESELLSHREPGCQTALR